MYIDRSVTKKKIKIRISTQKQQRTEHKPTNERNRKEGGRERKEKRDVGGGIKQKIQKIKTTKNETENKKQNEEKIQE